ncbi:MAG: glycosyltransferase family 2 protein [Microscillaceae bacterium]|nr:glycosyltransferase family 2 protein [Microscillaceae bacterium]MDW8460474.1 glycosyltransferase family 2 protein [Cytophagales bacterium]
MLLSVVTTLYYSQAFVKPFYERVKSTIEKLQIEEYEIIFVNDGSPDQAKQEVLKLIAQDERVILVDLSRNFGHHQALRTGLEQSQGEYVFLIDVDLEEAPELLEPFWHELQAKPHADVVYGVQQKRKGKWFERNMGKLFYQIFNYLIDLNYPADTLTARLMKRPYVEAVLQFQEREFDLWCTFLLAGFEQIPYLTTKQSKGTSTYTLKRKIQMAIQSITAISNKPLYYIFYLGIFITFFAFGFIIYFTIAKFIYQDVVEGWTSLVVSIWAVGGIIIFSLGIIGIYISKIFTEIKQRPISIIKKIYKRKEKTPQNNGQNFERFE